MNKVSFPTIKLGNHIKQITLKVKNSDVIQDALIVYGVTNTDGIAITNNKASDDLGNYIILGENQFAYNPYRINVGSIGLSKERQSGVVSPAYVVFECMDSIDSEFLLYYLKSSLGINLIKWYGDRGGVRSALRFSDLKNIDFPAINIQQQKQILNKIKSLDKYLSELNSLLNETEIANLRQSILQQAIEGKLVPQHSNDESASVLLEKIKAEKEQLIKEKKIKKQKDLPPIKDEEKPFELPQGWEWCRLGDISSKIGAGSTPSGGREIYKSNGIKFIRSQNVYNDGLKLNDIVYISEEINAKMKNTIVQANDVLLNITGGSIGRCSVVHKDFDIGNVNQHVLIIRLLSISFEYIHKIIISPFIQNEIMLQQVGASREGFSALKTTNLLMPIPPLAEQQRIVEKVNSLMALCDELEQEVKTAKKYASQLMEAVLQEAFTEPHTKADGADVVEFAPCVKTVVDEEEILMAARGKIKEDTMNNLLSRAKELVDKGV